MKSECVRSIERRALARARAFVFVADEQTFLMRAATQNRHEKHTAIGIVYDNAGAPFKSFLIRNYRRQLHNSSCSSVIHFMMTYYV